MFGYHDDSSCGFDLWAPWGNSAVENRAFSAYAKHSQEVEDVIKQFGFGTMSIDCDDEMSDADIHYIKDEVKRRYGIDVDFS